MKRNSRAAHLVGDALRQKRESLALSRAKVANAAGIQEQTLYMIERGDRLPMADTLARLAKVLGIEDWTLEQFLTYKWVEQKTGSIPEMVLQLVEDSSEAMRSLIVSGRRAARTASRSPLIPPDRAAS